MLGIAVLADVVWTCLVVGKLCNNLRHQVIGDSCCNCRVREDQIAQTRSKPYTSFMLTGNSFRPWKSQSSWGVALLLIPLLAQCGGQTELVSMEQSSGGSSSAAGGSTGTSTLNHSGGQVAVGGGTGDQCYSLTEALCLSTPGCMGIEGSATGDLSVRTYIECQSSVRGCTGALTCANVPGQSNICMLFSSGCIPKGWTETLSCPLPGCPSIAP